MLGSLSKSSNPSAGTGSPIDFPAVSIRHKTFGIDVPAVQLQQGDILGIFGKSGSGKTTYLKAVREHFPSERVLYMSQFDSLLEESTIRQNIELGLACSAKPAADFVQWERTFGDLLAEFEVDRHLTKYPRMMSGGQRKRAEIVRSLMMDPDILLLDEPFSGIGHLFESVSTKHLLARADRKKGVTVIVSHDFDLLCRFSRSILLVDDKGVIEIAPVSDPTWKPRNLRAAWTLGVDNLIPADFLSSMTQAISVERGKMLAFWGRQSQWKKTAADDLELTINAEQITSRRTFMRHGDVYTQIEMALNDAEKPLLLIGKGDAPASGDVILSVKEQWIIENNE